MAGSKELTNMKKESETKAIEEWLRTVDRPGPLSNLRNQ